MVEFKLKLPRTQNIVWIPKPVADCLGRDLRIMPNSAAAVVYSASADTTDIIESLQVLLHDLQNKAKRETKLSKKA
jgi:hypothetical protein